MTQTISCLYASPDKAAAVVAELKKDPHYAKSVQVEPAPGGTRVTVQAPFGAAVAAIRIMDAQEPLESDVTLPSDFGVMDDPAPLSKFFKLPVLTRGKALFGGLLSSDWSLSRRLGLSMLSDEAAPLSDKLHLPVLSKSGPSFPVFLSSKNPAPLSSALGLPTLADGPDSSR